MRPVERYMFGLLVVATMITSILFLVVWCVSDYASQPRNEFVFKADSPLYAGDGASFYVQDKDSVNNTAIYEHYNNEQLSRANYEQISYEQAKSKNMTLKIVPYRPQYED